MTIHAKLPSKKVLASSVYALIAVMSSAALVGCKTTASDTSDVTVSPTSLTLAPGGGAETVSIVGDGDVNLNGVSIDFGDYASDFDSSSVSSCGTANISGDTCTLSLKLASSAEETTTAIPVTVEGNQINSVDLSVNAAYATEQVSPDEVIFTDVDSSGQTVTVSNTSDSPFTINSLELVNTNTSTAYSGSEFTLLDTSGCTNVTLAKDESCSFKVATQTNPHYDPDGADVLLDTPGIEDGDIRLPVVTQLTDPLVFTGDGSDIVDDSVESVLQSASTSGYFTIENTSNFIFDDTTTALDVDSFADNITLADDTSVGDSCDQDELAAGARCVVKLSTTEEDGFGALLDNGSINESESSNLSLTTDGTSIDSQPVTISQNNVVLVPDALDNLGLTSILLDNIGSSTSDLTTEIATPSGATGDLIELPGSDGPTFDGISNCAVTGSDVTPPDAGQVCRLVIRSTTDNVVSSSDQTSTLAFTSLDESFEIATNANLYAAGYFTASSGGSIPLEHIAKWNGNAWSEVAGGLGSGTINNVEPVYALALDRDNGFLVAGGDFNDTGDNALLLEKVGYFDGLGWNAVSSSGGFNGEVEALAINDVDPASPIVYAGGAFSDFRTLRVAEAVLGSSSTIWTAVGDPGLSGSVYSLAFDSSNQMLYAGGFFSSPEGVAEYDTASASATWSQAGDGVINSGSANAQIPALLINNSILYATGNFDQNNDGSTTLNGYAQISLPATSNTWSNISSDAPVSRAETFAVDNDNNVLYAGGDFATATPSGNRLNDIAQVSLDSPGNWTTVGSGFDNPVYALLINDGNLYAAGNFTSGLNRIASFDIDGGGDWQVVGTGFNSGGRTLAIVPAIGTPTVVE